MADSKKNFLPSATPASKSNQRHQPQSFLHLALHEYFETEGSLLLKHLIKEVLKNEAPTLVEDLSISNENDSDIFLNTEETYTFLKIRRTSLYKHSKNNPDFPKPKHVGRRLVYSKKSLIEYLNKVKNYHREPP